jgi:glycosyltransferase involved in cell wall biosynthesis
MPSAGNRVLIIVQNLPVPFDRRVWLEATTLTKAGYDVTVICPKLKGFNRSYERLEGVSIYRYAMPFDPSTKLGFVAEFAWAWLRTALLSVRVTLLGGGFDIIHACNPPETYWALARLWRLGGKRFLFDHHDLSPEMYSAKFDGEAGLIHRALLMMERATFSTADVVITTNESHKAIAVERGSMDPEDVFVVRSGPDLARFSRFDPDPAWRGEAKHAIAYLGDISAQDGVAGLMEALHVIKHEMYRDDVHCVVIGGGSALDDVKAVAAREGVADICTFTGIVSDEDLCRILSSVDIGVDPVPKNDWSDKSTMNKIVEYMYFGLPVVSFDLAEAMYSAGDAGVYATENSPLGLATVIVDLLDDPDRREAMGELGRRRLEDELAWQHSVPPLLSAYEAVRQSQD